MSSKDYQIVMDKTRTKPVRTSIGRRTVGKKLEIFLELEWEEVLNWEMLICSETTRFILFCVRG